jgi:ankyrin repeat protein
VEVVRILAERGADINKAMNDGATPLLVASQNGHVDVVRILIGRGADINKADNDGVTPLWIASLNGHVEVVSILAERGADINKAMNDGATPLHAASLKGHVEVVSILTEKGADINKTNSGGDTPLYVASEAGSEEVVKILLEKGAEINKAENEGQTPLIIAVSFGAFEIVEALLEYGANINAETNEGLTAFDFVNDGPPWARSEMEILLKTYQQKNVVTKNIKEYKRPNIPSLRSLAHSQLDTESTSKINENKLFQPGQLGGKRKTRKSTSKKKNKKTLSKKQKGGDLDSDLLIASQKGRLGVVRVLLERGADINKAHNHGETPLYVASRNGHLNVVRVLLAGGADINKADNRGVTPLAIASSSGRVNVVKLLLREGADINKASNTGWTPLSITSRMAPYCDGGQEEVVKVLKNYVVMENIKEYKRPNIPTLRSLAHSQLDTESTSAINENKLFQPGKLGGKKRRTRKHKNARGGGACMSTGKKPDEYSSHVFSRKKVHWDTGKIESESGKTPHTIDSVDEFKRNHKRNHKHTSPSDKTMFGSKVWFDSYSSGGGKSKKTTKRRKVTKRRKTLKRKNLKKNLKRKLADVNPKPIR